MTKPTCAYCGTRDFLVRAFSLPEFPDTVVWICAGCDDVRLRGTELQKAVMLVRAHELTIRQANIETVRSLPLRRNQRRRLLRDCEKDIPALLELFIEHAAHLPFMSTLRKR